MRLVPPYCFLAAVLLTFLATSLSAQQADGGAPALDKKPSNFVNDRLPSWVRFDGQFRMRFEDAGSRGFNNPEDGYLLSRTRFNITIKPVRWLKFFGQTQDARAFFQSVPHPVAPYQDTWDIRQAFVEVGNFESGPVAVRAGRQEINFGEQRLVGGLDWTNTARTFDAVRLSMRYSGYRLDAFASSVVDSHDQELNHHTQGNDLHGLYGGIDKLVPGATIEPYLLWRLAPTFLSPVLETGGHGKLDQKTLGFRWAGKLPGGFDYSMELAKQFGSWGGDSISAYAGHWLAGKKFAGAKWQPRWILEYNFASGDSNPKDGKRGTFDQLYPTGHLKYGLTDQVGWRNIEDAHTGVDWKLTKRFTATGGFHDYWLAERRDGLYNAASALISRSLTGTAGRHVGEELEFFGSYEVSKTLMLGAGYGHLFTGEFLNKTTKGHDYNYPYLMATYNF